MIPQTHATTEAPPYARPTNIFRPATKTLEAAAPHFRHYRRHFHAGPGGLHLQCAAQSSSLPELLLPTPKHNYKALPDRAQLLRGAKAARPARRKTTRKPSDIPFNTGEGLRAAYYVQDDAASYSSFKEHVHQIDLLFPEWLHVTRPSGNAAGHEQRQPPRISRDRRRHGARPRRAGTRSSESSRRPRKTRKSSPTSTTSIRHTQSWDPALARVLDGPGTTAPRCASRSSASLPHSRPIAASRWILRTCRTRRLRPISPSSRSFTPTCTRAICGSMSTPRLATDDAT